MEDEKITLDMASFKTLASDSRIAILKSLDERRKTLTELSKRFDLSASTVKEHMEKLTEADLVRLVDDGHKWKYYELTRKGRQILHPGTTNIWVMLAVTSLAFFYTLWDFGRALAPQPLLQATSDSGGALLGAAPEASKFVAESGQEALRDAGSQALPLGVETLPIYHILGIAVFALLMGVAITSIFYRNRQLKL